MKRKIFEIVWVLAAASLITWMVLPTKARAASIAMTESHGVEIVLTDEPCALPAVTNLPYRSTWKEKGKITAGCWALSQFDVVMSYWTDRTVAVIPAALFHKVTDI